MDTIFHLSKSRLTHFSISVVSGITLSILLILLSGVQVHAVDLSGFSAGNIMSDAVMSNKSTMSEAKIQSFLKSKNSCNNTNLSILTWHDSTRGYIAGKLNGKATKWWYNLKNGHFVCMADENFGGKSAANIIYRAAQDYSINPQVLIVLLQKEQSLVTDTYPNDHQYAAATGYDCPDTPTGCNSTNAGFERQIRLAASLFRNVLNGGWSNYPVGKNYIQYNPASSCGGTNVDIVNRATSSLYRYTPYQPNRAALNAGSGTGDSCSAYGNRNFYLFFTSWFGPTKGTPFITANDLTIYITGANNTYYHVQNRGQLADYGYGRNFSTIQKVSTSKLSSMTYKGELPYSARFEGNDIFAVSSGGLSRFTSRPLYETTYGFTMGSEANLSSTLLPAYGVNDDTTEVLKLSDAAPVFFIQDGKKHHITNRIAYSTLGNPAYSTRPSVVLSQAFADTIPDGSPILTTGAIVKATDTAKWYIWDGTKLLTLLPEVAKNLTITPSYQTKSAIITQLPVGATTVNRYVKASSGERYILHGNKKYLLSAADVSKLAISESSYISLPQTTLDVFSTATTALSSLQFIRFDLDSRVYQYESGALYIIRDRLDFTKLGGDMNNVVSVPSDFGKLLPINGYKLSAKRLVQFNGRPEVYLLDSTKSQLLHVPSREIAYQYGINLQNVIPIASTSDLQRYTIAPTSLTRILKAPDGSLWLIDRGGRYHIAYDRINTWLGIRDTGNLSASSYEIIGIAPNKGLLSQYLRNVSTGVVYKISSGEKRPYATRARFEKDAKWSWVQDTSSDFLNTLKTGASIR